MVPDIEESSGNTAVFESIDHLSINTHSALRKAFFTIGKDLKKEFEKQVLSKNKTGRIYFIRTKSGGRKRHQSSAPGETPANLTGNYRKSIGYKAQKNQLIFGNSAHYAGFLETGTSRMRARPGLGNSIRDSHRNIERIFNTSITKSVSPE